MYDILVIDVLNFEQKFVRKDDDECWEWSGGRTRAGYGQFYFRGYRDYAHRISYQIYVGIIPERKGILHKCDNPCCVNPNHLFPGTQKDNGQDMVSKGRARGKIHHNGGKRKKVLDNVTGDIFNSINEASTSTGLYRSMIAYSCNTGEWIRSVDLTPHNFSFL